MDIGKRIKQRRLELKFTQEKLALLCGWEAASRRIGNYETGTRTPSIPDVIKLGKALKKSPCWIAFGKD